MRIGYGYDSHVFEPGRRLVLGGVEIPECPGLKAHSDGDVLVHAIIDALFGAAALGDIGSHFPDTDARWKDADSISMLKAACAELAREGYSVQNVDATVVCEKPRLSPFVEAMRRTIAGAMGIAPGQVSVKGKTNEKMDDIGAGRGVAAHASVLVD